jgi:hypothetical protein
MDRRGFSMEPSEGSIWEAQRPGGKMDNRHTLEIFISDRELPGSDPGEVYIELRRNLYKYKEYIERVSEYYDAMEAGTHFRILPKREFLERLDNVNFLLGTTR